MKILQDTETKGVASVLLLPVLSAVCLSAGFTDARKEANKEKKPAYLTAEGRLAFSFQLTDKQGGFAGFTGQRYDVAPDGSWTITRVFNERKFLPHARGKLSPRQLQEFGRLLGKNKIHQLPATLGNRRQVNPLILEVRFGPTHSVCALPPGLEDPAKLPPQSKLRDVGRRLLAVRAFLRKNLRPTTARK